MNQNNFMRHIMKKTYFLPIVIALMMALSLIGCTTTNPYTGQSEVSKTALGVGGGALAGALAGSMVGNTKATLIGAGIGAVVGGMAGNYMDNQEAALRERLVGSGVQVARFGNDLRLIMQSDVTFDNDRSEIKPDFYNTLNSVATVLNKFDRTSIRIVGYTSSTGGDTHNQILSEQRAQSVGNYLIAQGISSNRVTTLGAGKRNPVASNSTFDGQAKNRRVEITIHQI
jgi:outer membrane protein OmpA-like peptidoglycan-associated protein